MEKAPVLALCSLPLYLCNGRTERKKGPREREILLAQSPCCAPHHGQAAGQTAITMGTVRATNYKWAPLHAVAMLGVIFRPVAITIILLLLLAASFRLLFSEITVLGRLKTEGKRERELTWTPSRINSMKSVSLKTNKLLTTEAFFIRGSHFRLWHTRAHCSRDHCGGQIEVNVNVNINGIDSKRTIKWSWWSGGQATAHDGSWVFSANLLFACL